MIDERNRDSNRALQGSLGLLALLLAASLAQSCSIEQKLVQLAGDVSAVKEELDSVTSELSTLKTTLESVESTVEDVHGTVDDIEIDLNSWR